MTVLPIAFLSTLQMCSSMQLALTLSVPNVASPKFPSADFEPLFSVRCHFHNCVSFATRRSCTQAFSRITMSPSYTGMALSMVLFYTSRPYYTSAGFRPSVILVVVGTCSLRPPRSPCFPFPSRTLIQLHARVWRNTLYSSGLPYVSAAKTFAASAFLRCWADLALPVCRPLLSCRSPR